MVGSKIPRAMEPLVLRALADTPVVMLAGPRQAGKSTLAQGLAAGPHRATYVTLDDASTLSAALSDPTAFVARGEQALVIDEVQRAPDLLLAIKAAVDRDRRPGRFLLTGSADVMTLPRVSESLAGRIELLRLSPFTQAEIEGRPHSRTIARMFSPSGDLLVTQPVDRRELLERVLRGGFPPAVARTDPERRVAWFDNYLSTTTQRDVRDIANIEHAVELPRLLRALAFRTTQPLNRSGIAQTLGMPATTITRYLALLELLFLVQRVPAWHGNAGRRLVKSPKLLVADSGLSAALTGASLDAFERGADVGAAVEAFVGVELGRLAATDPTRATLHHYRVSRGSAEIDFVLEAPDGRVVGIEVKAGATVTGRDARHLAGLRDELGDRFVRGIVLYAGERTLPFGDRVCAVPISVLWAPPA